jgi:DNA-binding NarL/FixJ family response regulator
MAAQEAVQRHAWINETTGWLPQLGELNDPIQLGVRHWDEADTSVADSPGRARGIQAYIPRDIDTQLDAAISRGGIVLVIGDQAVGKTRAAYEATRRLPQYMSLLVPHSLESLRAIVNSGVELTDVVVWLDDLERYFGSEEPDVGLLSSLTSSQQRVVVVATMRTRDYFARSAFKSREEFTAKENQRKKLSSLLNQSQRVYIEHRVSPTEYERAVGRPAEQRSFEGLHHHVEPFGDLPSGQHAIAQLTNREREVLELLANGRSSAEIADRLKLSPGTVRSHSRSIMRKLKVADRAAAARLFRGSEPG